MNFDFLGWCKEKNGELCDISTTPRFSFYLENIITDASFGFVSIGTTVSTFFDSAPVSIFIYPVI